jgi:hypothetical protein
MKKLIATAALLLMAPAWTLAQNTENQYRTQGYLFLGMGTGAPSYFNPFIVHVGGGGERFLHKGLSFGVEAGHTNWGGPAYPSAWIASGDFFYHFGRHARRGGVDPFLLGGASFVGYYQKGGGEHSPAGNFGGGADLWLAKHAALRLEFRDVVGATQFWPYTHYISFRVGVTFR